MTTRDGGGSGGDSGTHSKSQSDSLENNVGMPRIE